MPVDAVCSWQPVDALCSWQPVFKQRQIALRPLGRCVRAATNSAQKVKGESLKREVEKANLWGGAWPSLALSEGGSL